MTEEVKIAPNLYATVGKRRTTFYTRLGGNRISLGHDEHRAKIKLAALLELPTAEITIRALCDGYLAEQRQMRADGDDTALGENTLNRLQPLPEGRVQRDRLALGPLALTRFDPCLLIGIDPSKSAWHAGG